MSQGGSNIAIIAGKGELGVALPRDGLALLFGGFDLLDQGGDIFAVGLGIANGLLDIDLIEHSRNLLHANWDTRRAIRLLGVQTTGFEKDQGQLDLIDGARTERWRQALEAADKLRDRYGESAVALGSGMRGHYRERVQENPAALPGREPLGKAPRKK